MAENRTNIELASGVSLAEVRDKPFTITCVLIEGPDGKPQLSARYPHRMKKEGNGFFRIERCAP